VAQNASAAPAASGKRFDIGAPIGLLLGWGAVLVAFILDGGQISALVRVPSMILVFGGTIGALIICFPLPIILRIPTFVRMALFADSDDPLITVQTFVRLADKARREGLLSLEEEAQGIENELLREGIQEVVDGTAAEQIQDLLEIRIGAVETRHKEGWYLFEQAGGFAPTLGIIGTVVSLVLVLTQLNTLGTAGLGEAISGAFIATLYGVSSANLFWGPIGQRLKKKSEAEVEKMRMTIEGILGLQAGDAPRLVRAKLEGYLSPADRVRSQQSGQQGSPNLAAAAAGAR
jgi:chemotaxis protein MotA